MQRRLILCGTLYGSLLIFSADSASESSTNSKSVTKVNNNNNKRKPRKLPPKHSKLEFDSKPLAKLKVSNAPIVQVGEERSTGNTNLFIMATTRLTTIFITSAGGHWFHRIFHTPLLLIKHKSSIKGEGFTKKHYFEITSFLSI